MRRTVALGGLLVALTAPTHVQPAFDRTQVEREAMAVLDSLIIALNRHDAQAEERTYQFPHYRLANGTMSMWAAPGTEVRGWMNGTYQNLRASGVGPQCLDAATIHQHLGLEGAYRHRVRAIPQGRFVDRQI